MRDLDGVFLAGLIVLIVSSGLGLASSKDSGKVKLPYFLILAGALSLLVSFVLRRI